MKVRSSVFQDMFYPAQSEILVDMLDRFFREVTEDFPVPKAIIAPHAGYRYSGQTAAYAFKCLEHSKHIKRVIVIAPSHQHPFNGVAVTNANVFQTPLGEITVAQDICRQLTHDFDFVHVCEEAFNHEHSLEVQLPFLQHILHTFQLVPIIIGRTTYQQVSRMLLSIWNGPETLIVVSSDLSHYQPYAMANQIDYATAKAVEHSLIEQISSEQACGQIGMLALMNIAKSKKLQVKCVDLRNSGDVTGDHGRVVGYGAFHFYEHKQ